MGWGLGLGFVGVSRTRQDQRLGGGEERDNEKTEAQRTREAVQLVVASGSRERSEVFMEPERLGAMRCGHQSWLRCGVGARGLGARGEEVSRASQPVVDRSVALIDLFALISDRLRVDSR